ncbi:MAG: hypothetical protein AAFX06_16095, partial [Planctomycetota bacterium]
TENGKPVLVDSAPVIVRALVRYIGQPGSFEPEISTHRFPLGSWLCLATDGVRKASIQRLFTDRVATELKSPLSDFCRACSNESNDDATILIQRLGKRPSISDLEARLGSLHDLENHEFDELISTIKSNPDVNPDLVFARVMAETEEARAKKLLAVLAGDARRINKERWVALLDSACEQNWKQVSGELVALIRTL